MTIKECIDIVDDVKPNQYSIEEKVRWLSFLDHLIVNDVLKTHHDYDSKYDTFAGYDPNKLGVKLIAPAPYDELYVQYIKMKIDESNSETARYNNSATMFNSYMQTFRKWYNSEHLPLQTNYLHNFVGGNTYGIPDDGSC